MSLAVMLARAEFPVGFLLLCGVVTLVAALLVLGILVGVNWEHNLRR
jgi:uncharacterized membrane protein YphA (DoxX/SURF4 family)